MRVTIQSNTFGSNCHIQIDWDPKWVSRVTRKVKRLWPNQDQNSSHFTDRAVLTHYTG